MFLVSMREKGIVFSRYTTNSNVCSSNLKISVRGFIHNINGNTNSSKKIRQPERDSLLTVATQNGLKSNTVSLLLIHSILFSMIYCKQLFNLHITVPVTIKTVNHSRSIWRTCALLAIQAHHLVNNSEMSHNFLFCSFYYTQDLIIKVNFQDSENTLYPFASSIQLRQLFLPSILRPLTSG